jgi:hypothetical protein
MGAYINPANGMDKKAWLDENSYGEPSTSPPEDAKQWMRADLLPVCLVDNGMFTAAGIAYSEQELNVFKTPDGRPKIWYLVEKEKLLDPEVSTLAHYLS